MIKYLGSSSVKMFPSAYRGQNVDAEAYFTTEGNLTKAEVLGFASKSFVDEYDGTNITIVIKGYRFDTTKAAIQALAGSGDEKIYADIRVVAKGADGTFNTLTGYEDTTQVILDDGTYFKGLAFSSDSTDLTSSALLVLENVEGVWGVPSASRLNVSPSQIRTSDSGADEDKSFSEKIVTDTLVASTINATSTTTQGLNVTQNATVSGSLTSQSLSVTQDASVSGSLTTQSLSVAQGVSVSGSLTSHDLEVAQDATIYGDLGVAENLEVTGATTCVGGMKSAIQYGNFAICDTAASVQIKDVTIPNFNLTGYNEEGVCVRILFKYGNTNSEPYIHFNNAEDYYLIKTSTTDFASAYALEANTVVELVCVRDPNAPGYVSHAYWFLVTGYRRNVQHSNTSSTSSLAEKLASFSSTPTWETRTLTYTSSPNPAYEGGGNMPLDDGKTYQFRMQCTSRDGYENYFDIGTFCLPISNKWNYFTFFVMGTNDDLTNSNQYIWRFEINHTKTTYSEIYNVNIHQVSYNSNQRAYQSTTCANIGTLTLYWRELK